MYQTETLLVVEDDPDIAELIVYNLKKNGYHVVHCLSGSDGLHATTQQTFDAIILDIMLPGLDGLSLLKKLREPQKPWCPVLLLTAKSEESDVVVGLELGADDYMTKPFSPKELVARIRALLRRRNAASAEAPQQEKTFASRVTAGPIEFDVEKHECFIRGKTLPLTLAEYRLLRTLVSKPGRVFTRDQLLEKMTGGEVFVIDRNVDVHVRAIRKKLEDDADLVMTVRGVGYKCRDHQASQ